MAPSLSEHWNSLKRSFNRRRNDDQQTALGASSSPDDTDLAGDVATSLADEGERGAEVTGAQSSPAQSAAHESAATGATSSSPTTVTAPATAATQTTVAPETPVTASAAATSPMSHRFLGVVVGIAAIGFALAFFKDFASMIAPIFFALNLMITVYPIHRWLVRHKVPSWLSAIVAGLVVFGVLIAFIAGLSYSITKMVTKLPEYGPQFTGLYNDFLKLLERWNLSESTILNQLKSIDPNSIVSVAGTVLSSTQNVASLLLVVITVLIFMVMDAPGFDERLGIARRSHGVFIDALEHFAQGIRKYWVVTTVFGLIVAVLDLAVLVGLGVPLALVWALFSFLTNYIPNVGFVIGVIPPALLALIEHGPKTAIAVVVAYSVLNFVVQSIIQPKFAGDAVGLSPTLSFISLLLWTYVLGPLGALLALPTSLLVKALLIDADPKTRWVNALISSRPSDAIRVADDSSKT